MKCLFTAFLFLSVMFVVSCSNNTAANNTATSGTNDAVNYVSNPSFESGLDGWAESGDPSAGFVYVTNDSTNGSQSAYIQSTNLLYYTNSLDQYVTYQSNKTYVLSAYLKDVVLNNKMMVLEVCDGSSNRLSSPYTNIAVLTGWSGWTNVVLVLAPTNVSGFLRVSFQVWKRAPTTAELYVDDVVLSNY